MAARRASRDGSGAAKTAARGAKGGARRSGSGARSSKAAGGRGRKVDARTAGAGVRASKAGARAAKSAARPGSAKVTKASPGTVEVGKRAPAFALESWCGQPISLGDYLGRAHVILYFYPKDMTPGCTNEACLFRDRHADMKRLGAAVLGVSPDSHESHAKFATTHQLNFPLLVDAGASVAKKYGAWKEKSLYGRTFMGIERSTFLIGKDGKVKQVWRKVKVDGHDAEVIASLRELERSP